MQILEEIGIEFLNEEALEIFKEAGCRVDGTNVRMGRDFVMEMVGKAPDTFTLTPRNLDRTIEVGGKNLLFGNVSSPPNYWSLDTGKVPGTRVYPFCGRLPGGTGRYPRLCPTFGCAL